LDLIIELVLIFGLPCLLLTYIIKYVPRLASLKVVPEGLAVLLFIATHVLLYYLSPNPVFVDKTKPLLEAIKPALTGGVGVITITLIFDIVHKVRSGLNTRNLK